jgi:hypothetical protein
MQIDFSELEDVKCDECDCTHFEEVYLLKKVPAIISPTAQSTLAPAQIFRCVECKHVNKELMPK